MLQSRISSTDRWFGRDFTLRSWIRDDVWCYLWKARYTRTRKILLANEATENNEKAKPNVIAMLTLTLVSLDVVMVPLKQRARLAMQISRYR